MRHLPLIQVAHRLAREVACLECYQRPRGSEGLGPEVTRTCEESCPLFVHLPALVSLAAAVGDHPGDCERCVKESVCTACRLSPTAGEFCTDYATGACPLSRYSGHVLAALQRVLGTRAS